MCALRGAGPDGTESRVWWMVWMFMCVGVSGLD